MSASAAKRTVLAAVSMLLFAAICIAGPAGGAQRDRVRPKAPTNPHVTAATPTSVTIAWGASADNVAVVGYDVYLGSKRTRVTGTSHALRKLACGSAFSVAVAAVDAAGNRSRRTSMIAASAACADSTRPSMPTGFRQAATSGDAVVLTWQPSNDDAGVVAYGVYDELTRISSSSESTTTLTGLACGSTDVVSIDAVDAAGNRSARQQVYVETAACPSASTMPVFSATASAEWTHCSMEREQCSFSGTAEVRYGANGTWTSPRSFTNGVTCANSVFGDPIYGVRKSCEIRSTGSPPTPPPTPPTTQWTYCTQEGTSCSFSGSREVRYGANGTWTSPRTFTNGVACTNRVFGDPLYGVVKSCHTRALPTSSAPPPPAPDTTPPAKPILSIGAVGRNTATLTWQRGVDNVGVDHYAVWLDGRLVTRTTGLSHTYTGLECDTQYVLGLQVVDAAGNTSVLGEALWPIRTTACSSTTSDQQAPTTPTGLGVSSATQTSVRLGWTASTDNVGVTGYDVERDGALATTVTAPGATVAGLTCGTSYGFGVKAFDAAGNRSSAASVVGSTSPCSDTQAPTAPTNVSASSRTATSIALSWTASSDNTGVVGYGLYRGGVLTGTTGAAPGIFSGLTCNTNYTLAVDAYDASGNRSPRVTIAAGTTACPDTTPPSTPTGLAASGVTQTGVTLSWSASTDGVGVAGYDVFRAGTKVATTTSTSSSQTGLACGTSYGFSVQAFDAAGNRSGQASITVATTACASPPPPSPGGAAVAVSPSGNDSTCVRGDLSRPCGTFSRAYQVAQCGDIVQVGAGTYGAQVFSAPDKTCAAHIAFVGSPSVTVASVRGGQCCSSSAGGSDWVELRGFKIAGRLELYTGTNNWRVTGIDGGSWDIAGAQNLHMSNNDWGPCASSGAPSCGGQNFLGGAPGLVIDGDRFHDFTITQSGDHFECIFVTGTAGNMVIRNSKFWNCQTYGIFFQAWHADHNFTGSLTIENNWFGRSANQGGGARNSAVTFASPKTVSNILIRFNSFAQGQSVTTEGGVAPSNTRVVGNILGTSVCVPGISYSFNLLRGGTCGSSDGSLGSMPYVNGSDLAGGDYHLVAGSPAEGFVTSQGADMLLARDIDGDSRGTMRDAGSDER